ncbi:fasciclin domain-containing protein [Fibrisoma montanum]|uniref:Fasciclin domain-containing protein n=1 Tax=Fibrisoma montanum TaxID=2305895 RepID=A0A418LWY2_9BACT|nr:fasciclin domain-containing protein [Fibrisoma montanum]RIV17694.1 fasciclin domain-containing protein [Fibrisoma montanum]
MKIRSLLLLEVLLTALLASLSFVHHPSGDIVDVAISSSDHTTLVAAVKSAGLVQTLKGKGPFTVFAPTNAAFERLPAGTVETFLKPESKPQLTRLLTYHVVPGKLDATSILKAIRKGNGQTTLTTVSGGKLTAGLSGNQVLLTDESGNLATVTTTDLKASNGIIHVIDRVVLPN